MANNQQEDTRLDIVGKTIFGVICHQYYQLNDVVIVQDVHGNCKAIKYTSFSEKVELHRIDGQEIEQIQVTNNGKMFLFHTKTKQYLVNEKNQIVEDSDVWADAYFNVAANSFYRKNGHGHWYDIEGFRLPEKVFLKDDVLISLFTKTSKQSVSFKDQDIYISENKQLIQVGKLVLNQNLNVVKYFGEKITGLGKINIAFEGKDVVQEVKLSLGESVFINEYTHEPFTFEDSKITQHLATYQYGSKRVVVFQAEKNSYGVEGSSNNFLTYNNRPLQFEDVHHVNFKDSELIKVSDGKKSFYFDLNKNQPFNLPELGNKHLSDMEAEYVRIGNSKVFNVSNSMEAFALREIDGSIFKLDEGTVKPERVEDAEGLHKYYGFAIVDGQRKMFSKKDAKILKFGRDELEVSSFTYNEGDKFINAVDTNGNELLLDIRLGFEGLAMATVSGDKIASFYGNTMSISNKTLLNVFIETLGGNIKRVININEKALSYFTLPTNLKQISDQEIPSTFASNLLCEIHYTKETKIDDKVFIAADFETYLGKEYPIILEKKSGSPLHLEGVGHRNELASKWVDYTVQNPYYLGENRMVGVHTISEGHKENKLLFSIEKGTSWLPFYNKYLPIFKQIIEVEKELSDTWEYHLFELREVGKHKEYIAVEKAAPYRILADKKDKGYLPRIVKSKKKSVKLPEELTYLQRFFYANSVVLVEVE